MSHAVEQEAKQIGMNFAAEKHRVILDTFRRIAMHFVVKDKVTIDDVREVAEELGYSYEPGNWLGSVFMRSEWEWTGEVRASTHSGSHGRMVKVWRRKHAVMS